MSVVDAMPEDKYGYAPTDGEFKGVRTFAGQIKHVAASNYEFAERSFKKSRPWISAARKDRRRSRPGPRSSSS